MTPKQQLLARAEEYLTVAQTDHFAPSKTDWMKLVGDLRDYIQNQPENEWQELANKMAEVLKHYCGVVAYAYDPNDRNAMKDEGKPARDILQEWQKLSAKPLPQPPSIEE